MVSRGHTNVWFYRVPTVESGPPLHAAGDPFPVCFTAAPNKPVATYRKVPLSMVAPSLCLGKAGAPFLRAWGVCD